MIEGEAAAASLGLQRTRNICVLAILKVP